MRQTGIFGGSFNPIHNGHIALAETIRRLAGLDEVWLMVSPQNPLKQSDGLLDDRLRMDMARKALEGHDALKASDYEMGLPRPSYTWNTLCHLTADYPDRRFTLIIGGDNWQLFDRWYRHDDIIKSYPVIVYPRRGSTLRQDDMPQGVTLVDTPLLDISSTAVRQRIAAGDDITGLVPETIRLQAISCYGAMSAKGRDAH